MNCDPSSLANAAKCYCFSERTADAVAIYLFCQWADNASAPPVSGDMIGNPALDEVFGDPGLNEIFGVP